MKKSKLINLVLVTTLFHACGPTTTDNDKVPRGRSRIYARTDASALYTRIDKDNTAWGDYSQYFYFEPYGYYDELTRHYVRTGYHSSGLHRSSSIFHSSSGHSSGKSSGSFSRGGFGSSSKIGS